MVEEKTNEMDIEEAENLPKLFISPTEKMMDEFTGSVKELRGLFKIPKSNNPTGSLHQQICNTAKAIRRNEWRLQSLWFGFYKR